MLHGYNNCHKRAHALRYAYQGSAQKATAPLPAGSRTIQVIKVSKTQCHVVTNDSYTRNLLPKAPNQDCHNKSDVAYFTSHVVAQVGIPHACGSFCLIKLQCPIITIKGVHRHKLSETLTVTKRGNINTGCSISRPASPDAM